MSDSATEDTQAAAKPHMVNWPAFLFEIEFLDKLAPWSQYARSRGEALFEALDYLRHTPGLKATVVGKSEGDLPVLEVIFVPFRIHFIIQGRYVIVLSYTDDDPDPAKNSRRGRSSTGLITAIAENTCAVGTILVSPPKKHELKPAPSFKPKMERLASPANSLRFRIYSSMVRGVTMWKLFSSMILDAGDRGTKFSGSSGNNRPQSISVWARALVQKTGLSCDLNGCGKTVERENARNFNHANGLVLVAARNMRVFTGKSAEIAKSLKSFAFPSKLLPGLIWNRIVIDGSIAGIKIFTAFFTFESHLPKDRNAAGKLTLDKGGNSASLINSLWIKNEFVRVAQYVS